jgi:hypothetical protein
MPSENDESDFVDSEFMESRESSVLGSQAGDVDTGLSDEELLEQASLAQQRLYQLQLEQDKVQQNLAELEESKRRRYECGVGREEALRDLTRGIAVLQKTEFDARAEAEQMTRTLEGLKEALSQVEAIDEKNWKSKDWNVQLSRDSAAVENARMEWNTARLKWTILNSSNLLAEEEEVQESKPLKPFTEPQSFVDMCRLGFALTWPVAVAVLAIGGLIVYALMRQ